MGRAIQYLVERGLLVRRRGVGTQVCTHVYRARRYSFEHTLVGH